MESAELVPVRHAVSPVREQTVNAIREQIMVGGLAEGQRLVERDLCERLEVSRNTLREALRQLEAEGFLDIRPHRGPVVRRISLEEARSLYELREALEGLAIRLFTERADDDARASLTAAFAALAAAHERGDVADMLARKNAFYDALYVGAGNEPLRRQAQLIQDRVTLLRARSLGQPGRPTSSLTEIRSVMQAIEAGNADEASAAWCQHIRSAASTVLDILDGSAKA